MSELVDSASFPIERYEPLELLGQGALGQVYLCNDRQLGKQVAVKCLLALTDERVVMFQNEARIVSKISHESVIKVLDFGTTSSGRPFMVMEYFDSRSLEYLLAMEGKLAERAAREVFILVAEALRCLHENGIYHRDLKPSNILISNVPDPASPIRLIDFGISKSTQEVQSSTLIQGRTVVGTPSYMSPDQVAGRAFDATSEIYSLGCVMFETLTGAPPFKADTALEVLNKHMHEPVPNLQKLEPDLSDQICEVIEKCLRKEQQERYQSVSQLIDDLRAQQNLDAEPTSQLDERKPPPSSPSSLKLVSLFIVLALLITASAMFVFLAKPDSRVDTNKSKSQEHKADDAILIKEDLGMMNLMPQNALDSIADDLDNQSAYTAQQSTNFRDLVFYESRKMRDQDAAELEGSTRLESLILSRSPVTDAVFSHLKGLPRLVDLEIDQCEIKTLDDIDRLKHLKYLALNETEVEDRSLEKLVGLSQLRILLLSSNQITNDGLAILANMPQLVSLSLDGSKITDVGLTKLKGLKKLRALSLARTAVSANGVRTLVSSLPDILVVNVSGCKAIDSNQLRALRKASPCVTFATDLRDAGGELLGENAHFLATHMSSDAPKAYLQTIAVWEESVGTDGIRLSNIYKSLGRAYRAMCDFKSARGAFEKALNIMESKNSPVLCVELLGDLALASFDGNDGTKAEPIMRKWHQSIEAAYHDNPRDRLKQHELMAACYAANHKTREALKEIDLCREIYKTAGSVVALEFAAAAICEGDCLVVINKPDDAERSYREALRIIEKNGRLHAENAATMAIYRGFSDVEFLRGNFLKALVFNNKALEFKTDKLFDLQTLEQRRVILTVLHRDKEAAEVVEKIEKLTRPLKNRG